jgi:hypothetical protein
MSSFFFKTKVRFPHEIKLFVYIFLVGHLSGAIRNRCFKNLTLDGKEFQPARTL